MDLDTYAWLTKWFLTILVSGLVMMGIALDMRKSRENHNSDTDNDISQEEYDRMSARVDSVSATLAKTLAFMEEIERAMNQAEKENDTTDEHSSDDDMSQETPDTRSAETDRMLADMEEREQALIQLMGDRGKVLVTVGCRDKPYCLAWRSQGESHDLTEAEEDKRAEEARQAAENHKAYLESAAYLDHCVTVVDPSLERIVVGHEIYVVADKEIRQTGHRIDDKMVFTSYYRGAVFEKPESGSHSLRGARLRDIEISGEEIAALRKNRTEPGSTVYVTEWIDPHPERRRSPHGAGSPLWF